MWNLRKLHLRAPCSEGPDGLGRTRHDELEVTEDSDSCRVVLTLQADTGNNDSYAH